MADLDDLRSAEQPKPPQIVFGKDDPMFKLTWRNHGRGDRHKEGTPQAAPRGCCQRCGQINLRYVHTMECADLPDLIEVGCDCAQILDPSYDAPRAERLMKTRSRRLARWLSLGWQCVVGNQYLNRAGFDYGVVPVAGGWGWWIEGAVSITSKIAYDCPDKARVALFDYADGRNLRGGIAPSLQPVTLVTSLRDIEQVCYEWASGFSWLSDEFYRLDRFTLLGKIGCSVYVNGRSAPYWELCLTLPDQENGSRKHEGPKRTCTTAVEAKIAALDIFRKEMVQMAYKRASVQLEVLLPPITDAERQRITDAHLRAENEQDARRAAEQRAREEAAERRRGEEEQQREIAQQAARAEAARQRREEAAQEAAAKQTLAACRRILAMRPEIAQDLAQRTDDFGSDERAWGEAFQRTKTGSFMQDFTIIRRPEMSLSGRCTVYYKHGDWKIAVFLPFDLVPHWHREGYDCADALAASRVVARSKLAAWTRGVLQPSYDVA